MDFRTALPHNSNDDILSEEVWNESGDGENHNNG